MSINPILLNEAAKLTNQTIKTFGEYMNTREVEITERIRIAATLTAITEKINADREVFNYFIANSLSERERLYQMADKVLNKAIENADSQMMKLALDYTVQIYSKNLLEGFEQNAQDSLSAEVKGLIK